MQLGGRTRPLAVCTRIEWEHVFICLAVQFLRADRSPPTATWWQRVAADPGAPVILRELVRDDSVVAERPEVQAALAWARRQEGWTDDPGAAVRLRPARRLTAGRRTGSHPPAHGVARYPGAPVAPHNVHPSCPLPSGAMIAFSPNAVRRATSADDAALARLAALDSQPPLAGRVLLAEQHDEPVAALSIDDGRWVADPFRATAAAVAALRVRADAVTAFQRTPSLSDRIRAAIRITPRPAYGSA
jgi:hypothetical protein